MKKRLTALCLVWMLAVAFALPAFAYTDVKVEEGYDYGRFRDDNITLNVYNWGIYISEGEDLLEVNKAFEELTGIHIHYTTYDTNETMYAKIKSGGANYDVVFPSDYMVSKMSGEGLLAKLNFENIPNFAMIGDSYKSLPYDPDNQYSVPYTWGLVGLAYNKTMVDEADLAQGWRILWDEKYAGQILMFNNSRDAFAIAARVLGYPINPENVQQIQEEAELLKQQKHLVQAYVMDEVFDKMEGGEAALAAYYAGDGVLMHNENPDIEMFIPPEGTNYYVDAACILNTSANKEAAEMYLNFLCETEVALANCEYIAYSTPQKNAEALLPEELRESPLLYPSSDVMANADPFVNLPEQLNLEMDKAWSEIRSYEQDGWYIAAVAILAAAAAITILYLRRRKKKKIENYE
ncbi:MAG: spermidine/putrescine ABC transporter substrate-binding protein [Oscillospiraceae bacterium]|nr:spermidine/putrescine ABC transporter substrate-binding protein [Oscillospiraceae bacterium]